MLGAKGGSEGGWEGEEGEGRSCEYIQCHVEVKYKEWYILVLEPITEDSVPYSVCIKHSTAYTTIRNMHDYNEYSVYQGFIRWERGFLTEAISFPSP